MCLAIPAKVLSIEGNTAVVDYGGVKRDANITLVEVKEGKYVLIHAGYAIQVLDDQEARETLEVWKEVLNSGDPQTPDQC